MQIITYEATEIWPIFQKEKESLRTHLKQIAENPEFDVVIYLTEEDRGSDMLPNILVYLDDREVYAEAAVNEKDCEQTVKKIYCEYLTDRLISRLAADGYYNDDAEVEYRQYQEHQEIDEREDELHAAVEDFLYEAIGESVYEYLGSDDDAEEIIEDCKEHFLEYLFRRWDIDLYRPMILEDEDGDEFFEEYPYQSMEFDDPDNPIYDP